MEGAFTHLVYAATRRIPAGRVVSYAAVAAAIGRRRAARAVGNALHCNPNPGPVPCHRVVASSGDLGGFAWGRRRKAELLRSEGVAIDRCGRVSDSAFIAIPAISPSR